MTVSKKDSPQVVLGIVVVLLGMLFLADSAGVLRAESGLKLWPVGVIALGLALAQKSDRVNRIVGVVHLVAGVWLLFNAVGVWEYSFWHTWPYLLVALGAWVLHRTAFLREREGPAGRGPRQPGNFDQQTTDAGSIGAFAFLNQVVRVATSSQFGGGELNVMFGTCDADLSGTQSERAEMSIDTLTLFGRVAIEVPAGWAVESRIVPLMSRVDNACADTVDPAHTLVLRGTSILGSIAISNPA